MAIIHAVRWLLLLLGISDLVALKAGWISHRPEMLAALFLAALIAFFVRLVQCIRTLVAGPRRNRALAETFVTSGVLIAVAAGMVNWLLGLQGFVILNQQETVQLHGGTELQAFDAGPLARLEEMGVVLGLDELELVAAGGGGFYPRSRLRIWRHHDEPISLEVEPRRSGTAGPLHFHQGAFGFAPRIVITKGADPETTAQSISKVWTKGCGATRPSTWRSAATARPSVRDGCCPDTSPTSTRVIASALPVSRDGRRS
jgi:hypothetical protein